MKKSLRQRLSGLKVGHKIGLGYALALGIAVAGTTIGFRVGNYYRSQAQLQEDHTRNEVEMLQKLQSSVLQTRTHQQQLLPLVQSVDDFQQEYTHLLNHKAEIQSVWAELETFADELSNSQELAHQGTILNFLMSHEKTPQLYAQELARRVEIIQALNLESTTDIQQAQQLMLEFTNSDLALQFDAISDELSSLIDHAYEEFEAVEILQQRANQIAERILVSSIGLAIVIAVVLSSLTSRAIAQPIETLTKVARRSIEESNFDLQVTLERDDEVGTLADTFNQLILSVKRLLQQQVTANEQLATYSQTLESKVEVRTQELYESNQQLQELLERLQHTQIQMVQGEKMSALGQMVAGVAHEINNPVNFIHGNLGHVQAYTQNLLRFVQLYREEYPNPSPRIQEEAEDIDIDFVQADLPKILKSMKMGTDRIRQIVLSLRNFSRMDEADFKAVDIHEGIDSTLLILQHRLKATPERPAIQVVRQYGSLPLVECYPAQLNQAFMNILANAIDALEEANVSSSYQELKETPNQISIQTSTDDSGWVKIILVDNGQGMPETVRKRIFDPFFTTKAVGKGTGMGMSISYQIITEKHGGNLEVYSTPGQGTEFVIRIPVRQQGPGAGQTARQTSSSHLLSAS